MDEAKDRLQKWLAQAKDFEARGCPGLALEPLEQIAEHLPAFGTAEEIGTTEGHLSILYRSAHLALAQLYWSREHPDETMARRHAWLAEKKIQWGQRKKLQT